MTDFYAPAIGFGVAGMTPRSVFVGRSRTISSWPSATPHTQASIEEDTSDA